MRFHQFKIALSAQMPAGDPGPGWKFQDRDTIEFVGLFSQLVFQSGGQIIQIYDPVLTAVVAEQASHYPSLSEHKRFRLLLNPAQAEELGQDGQDHYSDVADAWVIEPPDQLASGMDALLENLVGEANVLVIVGTHFVSAKEPDEQWMLTRKALERKMSCYVEAVTPAFVQSLHESTGQMPSNPDGMSPVHGSEDLVLQAAKLFYHLLDQAEIHEPEPVQKKNDTRYPLREWVSQAPTIEPGNISEDSANQDSSTKDLSMSEPDHPQVTLQSGVQNHPEHSSRSAELGGKVYCESGGRKTAKATVWLRTGTGNVVVNKRPLEQYFATASLRGEALRSLHATGWSRKVDVSVRVAGGGLHGQAGAISLALARALCEADPELRTVLKPEQLLTRDPRMKERKKSGQPGARKRFQFSKR